MATAAERQRRYRQRRRGGVMVVRVRLDRDDIDALVAAGLLPEWDSENRHAIEAALERARLRVAPRDVTDP